MGRRCSVSAPRRPGSDRPSWRSVWPGLGLHHRRRGVLNVPSSTYPDLGLAAPRWRRPARPPTPSRSPTVARPAANSCTEAGPFVAVQSSFKIQTWPKFDLGTDAGGDGLGDVGDRIVDINKVPPHGSTSFPVGTILVKTAGFGTADAGLDVRHGQARSLLQRLGRRGMEWFELQPQASGSVQVIIWRGVQQPAADVYGTAGVS